MSKPELCLVFHEENCIQCSACETACKIWNRVDCGISYRRVLNIWRGDFPNISSATLSLSCLHCVQPACLQVCPVQAVFKSSENGAVLVNEQECTGCEACFEACPFDVPQFREDGKMVKCTACIDKDYAPPCITTCPTNALELQAIPALQKGEFEAAMLALYKEYKSR